MNTKNLCSWLTRLLFSVSLWGATSAATAQLPPPPVSPAPVMSLEYDAQGNPTRTTLAPGVPGLNLSTSSSYDRLNRRKDTTDARSKTTLFEYNGRDDLTKVTDPRSLITEYPRNGLGEATALISPDTGATQNTYDAAGNLKTRRDNRDVLASYSYDALNRLSSVVYSHPSQASHVVAWNYDQTGPGFSNGIGRLTSTQFPGGSASYAYDPLGRMVSTTQAVATTTGTATLTTGYGYDSAGRITRITYPSGRVLYITHSGGIPTALSVAPDANAAALPLVTGLQFEPAPGGYGPARSWQWQLSSGALANERVFDVYGRVVRYPLGGAIRDISYDAAGRIRSYVHYNATSGVPVPQLDQYFGYDELDRIISVNTSVDAWVYAYDDNGNRTLVSVTNAGGTSSRTHTIAANSNRLLALDNPPRALAQDAAGNTYSDLQGRIGWTGTHDLAGRLVQLNSSPDGSSAYVTRYTYNALEQRVLVTPVSASCIGAERQCAAVSTRRAAIVYVYDQQGMLLGEYDSNGTPLREYVWLQGTPLAVIDGATTAPAIFYIYADHLDTPRTVIDRQGRQRWNWLAEPFGNSTPINNPLGFGVFDLNLRMPGQYWDRESGLVYNWHRTYDAGIGRYTQSDPIGLAGGINTYAYVDGNPLSYVDPNGLRGTGACSCPTPPASPPGASCDDNIRMTRRDRGPWLYDQVRNKGPWDYKQSGPQYQDFGNFNFGAVAGAAGLTLTQAQMGAGWAQQRAGTSRAAWGDPLRGPPYGDDPADQRQIELGYQYFRCNCWMNSGWQR